MVIGMTKQKVTGGENSIGLDSVAEKEMLDGDILLKDQISRLAIWKETSYERAQN